MTFNLADGAVIGSRYVSILSVPQSTSGAILKGDYVVIASYHSTYSYLTLYNTQLSTFTYWQTLDTFLYGAGFDSASGRIYIVGSKLVKGYISLFPLEAIAFHPEFTVSSISMILLSPSTDPIIAESGVTIQASNLIVVTPTSYTNQSVVYVQDVSVISDVNFQTNSQSYSVVETYSQTVTPDLT